MHINYRRLGMLLSLISTLGAAAAGPNVRWTQTLGGTTAYRLAVDAGGFCYLVGSFWENGLCGTNVLVSRGQSDVLVAKFSPEGSNIWAQTAGGIESEEGWN